MADAKHEAVVASLVAFSQGRHQSPSTLAREIGTWAVQREAELLQKVGQELAKEFRRLAEIKGEPTDDRFYLGMAAGFRHAWTQAAQMLEEKLNAD